MVPVISAPWNKRRMTPEQSVPFATEIFCGSEIHSDGGFLGPVSSDSWLIKYWPSISRPIVKCPLLSETACAPFDVPDAQMRMPASGILVMPSTTVPLTVAAVVSVSLACFLFGAATL